MKRIFQLMELILVVCVHAKTARMQRTVLLTLLAVSFASTGWTQETGSHPSLVKADPTLCATCHEDLMEGRPNAHAPAADDCTSCHDVSITEDGTRIALMEREPALCILCHDDKTSAAEGDLKTPHYPATDSCLTCHEPHASAVENLLVAATSELCGTCHDVEGLNESHGGQLTAATDCVACHQPHGSDLDRMLVGSKQHRPFADGTCNACHRQPFGDRIRLRARGERLCEACHGDIAGQAVDGGTLHAPVKGTARRAGCLACHDPHMSDQARLLNQEGQALCGTCHREVLAAATDENGHWAASDDCLNCHQPHTSAEKKLLSATEQELCQTCHDVDDEDLRGVHLGSDLEALDCLGCHDPHGSQHGKLLAQTLHPPVLDGCDTCHEGAFDKLIEDGDSPLCGFCHDDVLETAQSAKVPHPALEIARCADCHNPHASAQDRLVKSPGGEVCTQCHDDKAPGDGEIEHGVIGLIGCQGCHESHGGSRDKLLREEGDQLCLSCHGEGAIQVSGGNEEAMVFDRFSIPAQKARNVAVVRLSKDGTRGHPVLEHRVAGSPTERELRNTDATFEGELSCLTCHDPHKGRSETILRWGAASRDQACLHCHPK